MPSLRECIDTVKAADADLTDDQVMEIMDELTRLQAARRADAGLEDAERALFDDAEAIARDIEIGALVERRNAADNVLKFRRAMAQIDRFGDDPEGLRALKVGSNARIQGARNSVDATAQGLEARMLGGMVAELRRAGLLELLTRRGGRLGQGAGPLDARIAQEMWEASRPGGRPGASGSREARAIAAIFARYEDLAVLLQNRAGAHIRKLPGYIVRQSHDQARLRRAGFAAWRDAVLPRLDHAATFGGRDPEVFLKSAFDALASGDHLKADGAAPMLGFKGPSNLAKRLSQHRVLHFRTAADWMAYNDAFGMQSLVEAVVGGLRHAAQNVALMEKFGTNPRAMHDRLVNRLRLRNKDDAAVSEALRGGLVQAQFDVIDGTTRVPARLTAARIAHGVLSVQTMAKLGGATLSSITDIPLMASELRHQGDSLLTGYKTALEGLARGRGEGETRQLMDLIGAGTEGMIGDLGARFSATDQMPGVMSKLVQRFFKLNLLSWWTDAHKTSVGMVMSRRLAQLSDRPFAALSVDRQRSLAAQDITARQWDLLRAHAVFESAEGGRFLMPDRVQAAPDAAIAALVDGRPTARRLARARDELQARLQAYYADRIDFAVLTPGAAEQAIITRGFRPGTVEGTALRMIGQFKAFPLTVITKAWGREVAESGFWKTLGAAARGRAGTAQIAAMIVAMTALGYVAQSAKEMARGRSPRDPLSVATWIAAFTQGGGAGIYGDFLFGEFNRYGGGLLSTALGPTAGTVDELGRAWAAALRGEDFASTLFQAAKNNVPFANLFYTRAALDYLILYQIQEAMNPGYLARMQSRIETENGQSFLLPPTEALGVN